MILNLAAGSKRYPGDVLNVDLMEGEGIDYVADLSKYPWIWEDDAVDGIHASHILEHFSVADQEKFIRECHRILKPGGFLRIVVPHVTNVCSMGCFGHYKCFSVNSFHFYLDNPGILNAYLFKGMRFKTVENRINWLWETLGEGTTTAKIRKYLGPVEWMVNKAINFCPNFFERCWYPLVFGASECVWKGVKV